MKSILVALSVIAVCGATTHYIQPYYFRTPALDSSYVESSQNGGNFAYKTVTGHAYQAVAPLAYSYTGFPAYHYTYPGAQFIAPSYVPYQPAFIEQPAGFNPAVTIPAIGQPAVATEQKDLNDGRIVDDDTVAVDSA